MMGLSDFDGISRRTNMVHKAAEAWRPPLFSAPGGPVATITATLRRFLDLQAGSIWRDLEAILPHVRGTILDVGCGAQPYRALVPREAKYIGIDTADAKAHFGYEIPGTRYFTGDGWPVDDASVDFVLCTETMEHVPDPNRLLNEAIRALAPGGTLLLTVPFAARWHFIPYDYWRFTPSGLDRLLQNCGFLSTRVYARGNAVTVACYKTMALILRLAMPQTPGLVARTALRIAALPFVPFLIVLAAIGNLSLHGRGGDDCLGYTVLAVKGSNEHELG
jgi:SAM-dependent methyltransferase